ncbi:hypothetical protein ACFL96_18505 [Thermoproteota archaeon]
MPFNPLIYPFFFNGLTLAIILVSVILILRQKGSYFKSVQWLFIIAYLAFSSTVILEFIRDIFEGALIGYYYTTIGVSAIILANLALTYSAITIYYGIDSKSIIERTIGKVTWQRVLPIAIYTIFSVFLILSLWILSPFELGYLNRIYGDIAISPVFHDWYALGMLMLEIMFIGYPSYLLLKKGHMLKELPVGRALPVLAIAWVGVGLTLLLFNGLFRMINLEMVDIGNLISASLFISTMYYFRSTSLIESLFEAPIIKQVSDVLIHPFTEKLGLTHSDVLNKKMLFEIETSLNYEEIIKNFIDESIGNSELVIIFTRKGSSIFNTTLGHPNIRYFYMTPQVSYPKKGDKENEMLIPIKDNSIILSAMDKALKASVNVSISIVFDNLSDMILSLGMQKTYNFLNYSLEILTQPNVTALFLINPDSHESKEVSTIRGLFASRIVHSKEGLTIAKTN